MTQHSKRVEPDQLGVLGRNLVQEAFRPWNIDPDSVTYKSTKGFLGSQLPVVIEMGFAPDPDGAGDTSGNDRVMFGVNASPTLAHPGSTF